MLLPVALTTAGAAALVNLWLGIRVSRVRIAEKVLVGDGNNPRLVARMRAHLNFAEYTPVVLVLVALIELGAGTSFPLWLASGVYLLARVLHAFGMDGWRLGRMVGILLTWLVLLALAAYAILLAHSVGNPLR
jgi:uncharacterized protein